MRVLIRSFAGSLSLRRNLPFFLFILCNAKRTITNVLKRNNKRTRAPNNSTKKYDKKLHTYWSHNNNNAVLWTSIALLACAHAIVCERIYSFGRFLKIIFAKFFLSCLFPTQWSKYSEQNAPRWESTHWNDAMNNNNKHKPTVIRCWESNWNCVCIVWSAFLHFCLNISISVVASCSPF